MGGLAWKAALTRCGWSPSMPSQGWVMNHRWSPPSRSQHFSRESDDGQGRGLLGGPSAYWERREGGFLEYALPSCIQDARHRGAGQGGTRRCAVLNCHVLDRERWETTLEDSRDLEARQGSRSRQRALNKVAVICSKVCQVQPGSRGVKSGGNKI